MGAAYRARHVETGARHALKVLLPKLLDGPDEAVSRFLREGEALARVPRHEGVVAVHTQGRDRGLAWLAMDLAAGRSLAEVLEAGPLSPRRAAELLVQLADAVEHVHRSGIVHRDIKPQNVIVTEDGRPRLVDFGLAFIDSASRLTTAGDVLGTPAYMAPEQIEAGETGDAPGPSVDVWALGGVLHATLTGRPPFFGPPRQVILDVITKAPERPSRIVRTVPPELDAVCARALEKSPAARYASAADFAGELRRWLAGEGVEARVPGAATRLRRWIAPRRGRVIGVTLLTAAGAVALAALLLVPDAFLSPRERLGRAREALATRGHLDPAEREALPQIVSERPELAREARFVTLLAEALTESEPGTSTDALGQLLREEGEDDGDVEAARLTTTQHVLARHRRWRLIDAILHGAEPTLPVRASVDDVAIARPLADAIARGDLAPPRDRRALEALADSLVEEEAQLARLWVRWAQRRLEEGDRGALRDLLAALPDVPRAEGERLAVLARWDPELRAELARELYARLADDGRPIGADDAFLVAHLEYPGGLPLPDANAIRLRTAIALDESEETALERTVLASRFLARHGYSMGLTFRGPGPRLEHAEEMERRLREHLGAVRHEADVLISYAFFLAFDLVAARGPRRRLLLDALAAAESAEAVADADEREWIVGWIALLRARVIFGEGVIGYADIPSGATLDDVDLVARTAERALELERLHGEPARRWASLPSLLARTIAVRRPWLPGTADLPTVLRALELATAAESIRAAHSGANDPDGSFTHVRWIGPGQIAYVADRAAALATDAGAAACCSSERSLATILDDLVSASGGWPPGHRATVHAARAAHRLLHGDEAGAREDDAAAQALRARVPDGRRRPR